MNIQIHLHIGSLAQLKRASDYGSEGYRFESYASHLRILISFSVFGSNEIRIFSISTGRIIIIHIFAVNTKNILFKIKGKIKSERKDNTEKIKQYIEKWFQENTVLYRRIKSAFPKLQVFIKELEMRKKGKEKHES